MKTRALMLAVAAVFLTAPAYAAHSDNNHDNDNNRGKHQAEQRHDTQRSHPQSRNDAGHNQQQVRADKRQDIIDARQDHKMAVVENRMNRQITRENIREFRANTNASRRYHYSQAWNAPSGWRYQRYAYGQHMPSNFYASSYWIADFGGFGLYAPPQGYQWVRYGNDAVLVDVETGEIIRVEYNNFY